MPDRHAASRARIRAAVEGLLEDSDSPTANEMLAAVLAIIDGPPDA